MPLQPTDYTAVYFCTDEDVYAEAQDDYFRLLPDSRVLALGTDGVIAAVSPWALTSVSNNFGAQGVQPGDILRLGGSKVGATLSPAAQTFGLMSGGSTYRDGDAGRALAVNTVVANIANLREPGAAPGEGLPPTVVDLSSIIFRCGTLRSHILLASNRVRQDLDFDTESDIIAPEDIREVTVYQLLATRYRSRAAFMGSSRDDFAAKASNYQSMYKALIDALQARRRALYPTDSIPVVPTEPPWPWPLAWPPVPPVGP